MRSPAGGVPDEGLQQGNAIGCLSSSYHLTRDRDGSSTSPSNLPDARSRQAGGQHEAMGTSTNRREVCRMVNARERLIRSRRAYLVGWSRRECAGRRRDGGGRSACVIRASEAMRSTESRVNLALFGIAVQADVAQARISLSPTSGFKPPPGCDPRLLPLTFFNIPAHSTAIG